MHRSFALLLFSLFAAGCTSGGTHPGQLALVAEIMSPEDSLSLSGMSLSGVQELDPAPQEEDSTPEKKAPQEKKPAKMKFEEVPQEVVKWERMSQDAEIAIIKDYIKRTEHTRDTRIVSRRLGATGYMQLFYPTERKALDGLGEDNPDWKDLLDGGIGGGLEISCELIPAFQAFAGIKYDTYEDASVTLSSGGVPTVKYTSESLRFIPVYGGIRLNFPHCLGFKSGYDPKRAGFTSGIIPFIRVGGGAAYCFGNEQEVDLIPPQGAPSRTDFIRRGFCGYLEAGIGIEYRQENGFAVQASLGVERFSGLDLDRKYEKAFPGVSIRRNLDHGLLPRISVSIYF